MFGFKNYLYILVVVTSLFIVGWYYFNMSTSQSTTIMSSDTAIRFMPIGDSYTIGNGVNVSERWPNLLVESLKQQNIDITLISNPSVSGYDAQDAIERELPLFEKENPDFGTLFIGTNDSFRGRDLEVFKKNYIELVDRMQNSLTNKDNLIIITIPNYATFPGAKGYAVDTEEIEGYNRIIREIAGMRNLKVVDLYGINELVGSDYFISDGIHPSPKGINVWHNAILPVVLDVLQ
jgi:lysophospholipase L1-like esterase